MAHLRDEQAMMITETVTSVVETAIRKRGPISPPAVSSPKGRSITEAASRKKAAAGGQEIDKVIWPLLNTGLTVRAIALRASTSTATVGRSRKRWDATQKNVSSEMEEGETTEEA